MIHVTIHVCVATICRVPLQKSDWRLMETAKGVVHVPEMDLAGVSSADVRSAIAPHDPVANDGVVVAATSKALLSWCIRGS